MSGIVLQFPFYRKPRQLQALFCRNCPFLKKFSECTHLYIFRRASPLPQGARKGGHRGALRKLSKALSYRGAAHTGARIPEFSDICLSAFVSKREIYLSSCVGAAICRPCSTIPKFAETLCENVHFYRSTSDYKTIVRASCAGGRLPPLQPRG